MKETIAIVDPFFSGCNFPAIAEEYGYDAVWIQSDRLVKLPPLNKIPKYYLTYNNDLNQIIKILSALNVKALFAGCENGVLLADELSEVLGLITNGTALSLARRHKGEMKEVFNANNVPCARHCEFTRPTLADILSWIKSEGLEFPIVLKPAMGYGTINVFTCYDEEDIKNALHALNHQDLTDYSIDGRVTLAEEFLDGEEFVVDTLGNGEEDFITDMWTYEKIAFNGVHNVYKYIKIIEPRTELIPIALAAVKALGIKYGPSHVELKATSNGPKIMEVGARLVGAHIAELAKSATGWDVERATIEAFLGRKPRFEQKCYKLHQYARIVDTYTNKSGEIVEILGLKDIEKLPSHKKTFLNRLPGDRVEATTNITSSPAMIHLVHPNLNQLTIDGETCHKLFDLRVK